jgi:chemotaxis protein CheZ
MSVTTQSTDPLRDAVRAELHPALADLQRFMDRRIAELSAELHASVEISDMGEERMTSELARIHDQIGQLVAMPAAATRNSGLELEAVVQATEAAANTIMEAAEAIQDWVACGAQDKDAVAAITARVNSIFEACSFQDVTGQRIRRAIQHLQQVENMLETMIPDGARPEVPRQQVEVKTAIRTVETPAGGDLGQSAIDALLDDF